MAAGKLRRGNKLEGRSSTLWGVAVERPVHAAFTVLAESFGDDRGNPFFRVGGRYAAIKDRLDFDLSFVTRSGDRSTSARLRSEPRFPASQPASR